MGRELKRVPLDFEYPKRVWTGYYIRNAFTTCMLDGISMSSDEYKYLGDKGLKEKYCVGCRAFARAKGIPFCTYGEEPCPDFDTYFEDELKAIFDKCETPIGEGYQLWETTSEGAPISPVFATKEELAIWCADGATIFGYEKMSADEWLVFLKNAEPTKESEGGE